MKKIKFVFKEKDDIHTFHSAWQMLKPAIYSLFIRCSGVMNTLREGVPSKATGPKRA